MYTTPKRIVYNQSVLTNIACLKTAFYSSKILEIINFCDASHDYINMQA